jgi:hypothetical protein
MLLWDRSRVSSRPNKQQISDRVKVYRLYTSENIETYEVFLLELFHSEACH